MRLRDPAGRVHFLHEADEVLYTVEADSLLDTFHSVGELQDAINSLSVRDPMAQLTALSVIANSPYILEDSPLSSQILEKFATIFLHSDASNVVHGACDALAACVRNISPSTCIQYLEILLDAILRRIEAEEARDYVENENVGIIVLTLVSTSETLFSHVCSNVYSVLSNIAGLHGFGNLMGFFFHRVLVVYNRHLPEIQGYFSKTPAVVIANTPLDTIPATEPWLQYLILLDSLMEYADVWMRRINSLPYASEGAQDYFLTETIAESVAMAVHPGSNHICADTVADVLAHPCIIASVNSAAFNRHLLELSPSSITKHVLTSRYLSNVFLRLIFHNCLYKLPKFYIVTLTCCGVLGPLSLHFCEALHPLDLVPLLIHAIEETCPNGSGPKELTVGPSSTPMSPQKPIKLSTSKGKSDTRPDFNTNTKINYKNMEITARTTLPPLKTQLKLATQIQKPRTIFISDKGQRLPVVLTAENSYFSKNMTDAELKLSGTRKMCNKVLNLMNTLTGSGSGSKPAVINTANPQKVCDPKAKDLQCFAIDVFFTTFSEYRSFNPSTAQAVISGLLSQYSSVRNAPLPLCRVLGSSCFAPFLEKRVATILLHKAADTAIFLLGRGALSSSNCMLRAAITLKFANIRPHAKTVLHLHLQSEDILRQFLAVQIARNVIQRSGVLCMSLLSEFAETGVDNTLFITNRFYQTYQFDPSKPIAPSLDRQMLDFPYEFVRWLHIDGPSFEAWNNRQPNRHLSFAKMLSTISGKTP